MEPLGAWIIFAGIVVGCILFTGSIPVPFVILGFAVLWAMTVAHKLHSSGGTDEDDEE